MEDGNAESPQNCGHAEAEQTADRSQAGAGAGVAGNFRITPAIQGHRQESGPAGGNCWKTDQLRDYAERLINLRDEVKKGLTELEGLKRGELSLGVNESSIHALLPALATFRGLHPGVQVRVHRMFSRDIPHEVLNYRLDLGAISYVPRDPQLQATEILKDELTLVVPPKHVLAKKHEVDVADLAKENFIAHSVESPFRRRVIELFARHRAALNMPIEMPTIESIKRFVQMGMGVAIVPRMCVQWEIEHGWMKEVKIRQLNMPRHVYLVSRRGARLPHASAELMRILRVE